MLAQLEPVVAEVRGAVREQRTYYKATGKALAITTIRLGRLVENTDARMELLTRDSQQTLQVARESLATVTTGSQELLVTANRELETEGRESRETLATARAGIEEIREEIRPLWPPLTRTAESVAGSTRSVEIALEPLRKPAGRWKRLLLIFLGMLKINIL